VPIKGELSFNHGETEKVIEVEIMEKDNDVDDRSDCFNIKLSGAHPSGAKISKKDTCYIEIVGDNGKYFLNSIRTFVKG
jgi:hypothetical protein